MEHPDSCSSRGLCFTTLLWTLSPKNFFFPLVSFFLPLCPLYVHLPTYLAFFSLWEFFSFVDFSHLLGFVFSFLFVFSILPKFSFANTDFFSFGEEGRLAHLVPTTVQWGFFSPLYYNNVLNCFLIFQRMYINLFPQLG